MAAVSGQTRCVQRQTVEIMDRGGFTRLWDVKDLSEVSWGRKLNLTSLGISTLGAKSCADQIDILRQIQPKRHEMRIRREGATVWEGPIMEVAWGTDSVSIVAKDVSQYVQETALSKAWPNPDGGGPPLMTDRIEEILEHELATPYNMSIGTGGAVTVVAVPRWENLTPPANILPFLDVRPGTVLTRAVTEAFEMTLGEHLYNLSRSGVDFTTVGRQIIVWDSAEAIGRTRTVTDKDFNGALRVYASGTDLTTVVHLVAPMREEGAPGVGNAGGVDPYYGVWTEIMTRSDEETADTPTQDELNSQAQRVRRNRTPVPVEIVVPTGASLRLSHDLRIRDLVPGTEMPVRADLNLKPLRQTQRLTSMQVTETGSDETIEVTLTPFGDVEEL